MSSPRDKQPCAYHDRGMGEGANPQEYTLFKLWAVELKGKLAQLEVQTAALPGLELELVLPVALPSS